MSVLPEQPRHPSQAKDLFLDLLDVPRDRRDDELQRRAGGDANLIAAVRSLLEADDRAAGFLADPTVQASRIHLSAPSSSPDEPRQIGPYKLLQVIGEGGFGTVYMAEQEQPVRRRVALKVIKVGMDTRQVIARFEAERQALALMDHANVAKVFDAGQTGDGRPYFVMELVKGVPVTEYADERRLDIRARLELFAQVCHAVQHAHQKGLIHRDIKPSNVLVGEEDDRPLVKVIDFGIAKATQSRLTEKTLFTELRQLIGTPEYMSPEQAEGSLDIDTRTDVYALGVLLYELLCGTTPFDSRELRSKAYGEMQRLIREVEPPRPSTRLSAMRDELPAVAAQRAVEPRRLRSLIRGDLDWIVMRAMEKDRARRYESASALAADVARFLADEPVLAGPPGKAYRVRKFVRRHRGGVGAAAAILAVLVVGLAVTTRLYVREASALRRAVAAESDARRQRDDAVRARDAEAEARSLSEEADRFMRGIFESVDPVLTRGREVLAREVIDAAADRLEQAPPSRPAVEGRLRGFLGETYLVLGQSDKALAQLEHADALLFASTHETDPEYVNNLVDLARCYQYLDRFADAQQMFTLADELAPRAFGRDTPGAYVPRGYLVALLLRQNRVAEAAPLLDELLAFRLRTRGLGDTQTLATIGDIAWVRQLQGRFAEAEVILLEALPAARQKHGDGHPRVLALLNNLAQAQADNHKLADAERTQREVVEAVRRIYGPDHRNVFTVSSTHAQFLTRLGRFDEADAILTDAIDRATRTLGADHTSTLVNRSQRGQLLNRMNRLDEADRELIDVAQRLARVSGPDHPETLTAISTRAHVLTKRNELVEAERIYRDLLPRASRAQGPHHPSALGAACSLGYVLGRQNRWPEAEPFVADAYAGAARTGLTKADPAYGITYGECLVNLGKRAEAEPVLRGAEQALRRVPRPDPALAKRLSEAIALAGMRPTTAPTTQP